LIFRVGEQPIKRMSQILVRPLNESLQSVVLSNDALEVVVFPNSGARIYSIFHKPSETEFLWHHPTNLPRVYKSDEWFDDVFCGGWDELFPSCEACEFQGTHVPDHGELWAVPWEWTIEDAASALPRLYTGVTANIFPVRFERWLLLDPHEPVLHLHYRLQNLSARGLELIWGIHPLFNITPHHRIDLPPGNMQVDLSSSETLGKVGQSYRWPFLLTPSGTRDMRLLPTPETNTFAGHYCTQSSSNWFALTDTKKQVGIAVIYPQDIFRSLWLWQSYGGWQGLYHLAIEPWVGYPVRLDKAVEMGHHLSLAGEQTLDYKVSVSVYTGLTEVNNITKSGIAE
jgi:galactose mutarotase-like enzyme